MNESQEQNFTFTDADFWELIKDDPKAIEEYHGGLVELYLHFFAKKAIYSGDKLLAWYADQVIKKAISDLNVMEIRQIQYFKDFIHSVPNPEKYLKEL
jgi:hypothetical protein